MFIVIFCIPNKRSECLKKTLPIHTCTHAHTTRSLSHVLSQTLHPTLPRTSCMYMYCLRLSTPPCPVHHACTCPAHQVTIVRWSVETTSLFRVYTATGVRGRRRAAIISLRHRLHSNVGQGIDETRCHRHLPEGYACNLQKEYCAIRPRST